MYSLSTTQISFNPPNTQDDEIQSQAATINQLKQQIVDMEDVSWFMPL